jgi:hypothetical protein
VQTTVAEGPVCPTVLHLGVCIVYSRPLDMSVLHVTAAASKLLKFLFYGSPVLPLDVSVLQQPVLLLDVSVLQQPDSASGLLTYCIAACAASACV